MGSCVLGVDIGGTNIRVGAVGQTGKVRCFEKIPRIRVLDGSDPVRKLCGFLADFIGRYALEGQVAAVSVGFPGILNRACDTVVQVPNIPGLDGIHFVTPMQTALHVPVFLCKDVWTAFHYDMQKFAVPWDGVVIAVYVGTGIGNVIAVDGTILAGRNGAAGELGHIPLDGNREPCGCGNLGCVENYAAGKYLARLCEKDEFRGTPVGELFVRHSGHPLLLQFVDRIAMAAATEINILDPEAVLLGGGVLAMRDFPMELLSEKIREHSRKPNPSGNLRLIETSDDEQKGAVGAALYGWRKVICRPSAVSF